MSSRGRNLREATAGSALAIPYRRDGGTVDPFPTHSLKRTDRPTTVIHDDQVKRADQRTSGFHRAASGEYGDALVRESGRFVSKYPLAAGLSSTRKRLAPQGDGPESRAERCLPDDPLAMCLRVKETAYSLRVDLVGSCDLPPHAVFAHSRQDEKIELDPRYAVAILVDQDYKTSSASTGNDCISSSVSFHSYSISGFIACVLADYIRRLGYPARAHFSMNYQVAVPPILLWAGLGEMSRIGHIVVNPFLGPRFKAAIVTTDLPLAVDKPIDFGLQDFCSKCGKCAESCPAQAISYGDKVLSNGHEKWPLDVRKSTSMIVGNRHGSGCGTCIKVCPWNKADTPLHRTVNWTVRSFLAVRRAVIKADELLGYGKPDSERKWWLGPENT